MTIILFVFKTNCQLASCYDLISDSGHFLLVNFSCIHIQHIVQWHFRLFTFRFAIDRFFLFELFQTGCILFYTWKIVYILNPGQFKRAFTIIVFSYLYLQSRLYKEFLPTSACPAWDFSSIPYSSKNENIYCWECRIWTYTQIIGFLLDFIMRK